MTANTLTAQQVREFRDSFDEADDPDLAIACNRALGLDTRDEDCDEDEWQGILDTSKAMVKAAMTQRNAER